MITAYTGYDIPVRFTFKDSSGDPTIPDASTATYGIRLNDGSQDPDIWDLPLDLGPTATQVVITIEAADTTITNYFETRVVQVNYEKAAVPYILTEVVRIVDFPLHTVVPADVRAFLGINDSELPDAEIDVPRAYIEAQAAVGAAALATALSSGGPDYFKANDLVMCRAALNIFPSLELRIAQSEENGVKAFARISKLNLDRLYAYIINRYGDLISAIGTTDTVAPVLLILSTQADPITGS